MRRPPPQTRTRTRVRTDSDPLAPSGSLQAKDAASTRLDPEQRRQLGAFVRAHRERLPAPQPAGRRRTPGLRREELAARASISATWCTWIEQGREVRASPQALARLAIALALTRAERAYLFHLAGRRDPDAPEPSPISQAPDSLQQMVRSQVHPAYGLDRLCNACCWNDAAADLFDGWLGDGDDRNLLRFLFLDPRARTLLPDWEHRARRVLAEFRADYGLGLKDAPLRALVDQLIADSAAFARWWGMQDVLEREGGERLFDHPRRGRLKLRQHTYLLADRPDFKLVVLTPIRATTT